MRFNRNVIDFVIYFTKFIFIFGIKNNLIVESLKFIYSRILMFSKKDIIVLGMMIFALFLGAGNIIFPPMEGYSAGNPPSKYGTYRARTYDPLLVRQMLSQLS